jgi:hypothetical protein
VCSRSGTPATSLWSLVFTSADLSTLEGNFYFTLTIELSGATLLIGDVELVGLGLSDPDSPTYVDPES